MRALLVNKLKATAIHLSISIVIFIGILYLILFHWYPEPFFTAEGGWEGIRLMAFVDLVLGPTLTLIVFNHTKKKLVIVADLSIIAMIQITALVWGGHTVYSKRPVALAYYDYAFFTVTADYYAKQGVPIPDFSELDDNFPPLVAVRMPETEAEQQRFNELAARSVPIYAQSYLYVPVVSKLEQLKRNVVDIEEIMHYNAQMKEEILMKTGGEVDNYLYLALQAKFHNVIMIIDREGRYVDMVKVHERA